MVGQRVMKLVDGMVVKRVQQKAVHSVAKKDSMMVDKRVEW